MLGSFCSKVLYLPPFGRAYALPMSSSVTGIKHVWKFSTRSRSSWSQIAGRALKSCWLHRAFGLLPSWNQQALAQVCSRGASLVFAHSSHCLPWFCWVLRALATRSWLWEHLWGHTQCSPNEPFARRWHTSLPNTLEVTLLYCFDALRVSST